MSTRTNVLILAILASFIVVRFGVYGGGDGEKVPSRLDVAADQLTRYYRDQGTPAGWRVDEVHVEGKSVAVRVHLDGEERRALESAPEDLRAAGLATLCPIYNHRVWDMFSGGQHIRIDGIDDGGEVFLSRKCPRRGV